MLQRIYSAVQHHKLKTKMSIEQGKYLEKLIGWSRFQLRYF